MNGPNIAWNNYGWDFGISKYGNGYSPEWWENTFNNIEKFGGNSARIWIHCAGSLNPLFNSEGKCTGLNENLVKDLKNML